MPESVFGESPAGIDISADNHKRNNAAVITTYVLAVVFVALRFYTRFQMQEMQAASEDWMILAAWYVLRTSYAYKLFPLPADCDCKPRVYYHWYFQRHYVFLFVRSRSDREDTYGPFPCTTSPKWFGFYSPTFSSTLLQSLWLNCQRSFSTDASLGWPS